MTRGVHEAPTVSAAAWWPLHLPPTFPGNLRRATPHRCGEGRAPAALLDPLWPVFPTPVEPLLFF